MPHVPNVWLRKDKESPWIVEVMFQESLGDNWLYRRNKAIGRKIDDIGFETGDGIPYLRPEIQLLFKAGGTSFRKKDVDDLYTILPELPDEDKDWLKKSLQTEFPEGHDWIQRIEQDYGV